MTGMWQDWTWRRESGELLDNWGWLTDDELDLMTGRRARRAKPSHDDTPVRVPAGDAIGASVASHGTHHRTPKHRTR